MFFIAAGRAVTSEQHPHRGLSCFLLCCPSEQTGGAGDTAKTRTALHCFLGNRRTPGEWAVTAGALVLVSFSLIFSHTELLCILT